MWVVPVSSQWCVCVWHQLLFLTLPDARFCKAVCLQHWSSHSLISLLLLSKTSVSGAAWLWETSHDSTMHIMGKDNIFKFVLRTKYFNAWICWIEKVFPLYPYSPFLPLLPDATKVQSQSDRYFVGQQTSFLIGLWNMKSKHSWYGWSGRFRFGTDFETQTQY